MVLTGMVGDLSSVAAAFMGAVAVTALIWLCSKMVRSSVVLIIIGILVGYLCSSVITLLNFTATEEGLRSFVFWGMGDFGNVSMEALPVFGGLTVSGTLATSLLVKPLNALLLGPRYAESMGINVRRTRNVLMLLTGLLTAVVTAFWRSYRLHCAGSAPYGTSVVAHGRSSLAHPCHDMHWRSCGTAV